MNSTANALLHTIKATVVGVRPSKTSENTDVISLVTNDETARLFRLYAPHGQHQGASIVDVLTNDSITQFSWPS